MHGSDVHKDNAFVSMEYKNFKTRSKRGISVKIFLT